MDCWISELRPGEVELNFGILQATRHDKKDDRGNGTFKASQVPRPPTDSFGADLRPRVVTGRTSLELVGCADVVL